MNSTNRRLALIGVAILALLLGYGGDAIVAPNQIDRQPTLDWKTVSNMSACEATGPADCSGAHGIAIAHDGSYSIGPHRDGKPLTDKRRVTALATPTSDAAAMSALITAAPHRS
jgi:hypothetical protein